MSNTRLEKMKKMLKFILLVHYKVRNALTLNSLRYETPGMKRLGLVTKRLGYETSSTWQP